MRIVLLIFGIINLLIWGLLKYDYIMAKVISIKHSMLGRGYKIFVENLEVTYNIDNKEYKQVINVSKKSPLYHLYYDSIEKYIDIETQDCKIYVSKRFPKLIIDNIDRLIINLSVGIISILAGTILYII